jgi:hypothetical protein
MLTHAPDFYVQAIVDREHDKDTRSWHSNRCVLIGDAAHPATPALFQGANLAIEDAHLLVNILSKAQTSYPLPKLFEQFAKQRIKHVVRVQKVSFQQTKLSQVNSTPSVLLRDTALKMLPARFIERTLRKTTSWDPRAALKDVFEKNGSKSLKSFRSDDEVSVTSSAGSSKRYTTVTCRSSKEAAMAAANAACEMSTSEFDPLEEGSSCIPSPVPSSLESNYAYVAQGLTDLTFEERRSISSQASDSLCSFMSAKPTAGKRASVSSFQGASWTPVEPEVDSKKRLNVNPYLAYADDPVVPRALEGDHHVNPTYIDDLLG